MSKPQKKQFVIDLTNINEKIYNLIKDRITHFEYPPGYQISVRELQDELGVSNSPVKDALSRLAGEGLVEITSRKGTFVRDISPRDLGEIEQVREMLEIGAVDVVAEKITDEQIAALEKKYQETLIPKKSFDYSSFMDKDSQFHLEIIKLAKNQRLVDIYRQLNAHIQIFRFQKARNRKEPLPWTHQDHQKIIEALRNRDVKSAKQAIRQHRAAAREAFLDADLKKDKS